MATTLSHVAASHAAWLVEGTRLVVAACLGAVVAVVQRRTRRGTPLGRLMGQACVLLCLSGAFTTLIIGDSLPRAFGIAGAAAIIRFRTPVDDPRDATVLFLLMAIGMATGLGLVTVTMVGTAVVCACLLLLRGKSREETTSMKVELVAASREFPEAHVSSVFAAHGIAAERLEFVWGERAVMRYRTALRPNTRLDDVSAALVGNGVVPGIASVSWERSKRDCRAEGSER